MHISIALTFTKIQKNAQVSAALLRSQRQAAVAGMTRNTAAENLVPHLCETAFYPFGDAPSETQQFKLSAQSRIRCSPFSEAAPSSI